MERYLCIHGHFYQPPRENPWLEAIELQDSAYPFHDWNERITDECYAANARSRILDGEGRLDKIINNYEWISFNFGPTLLSWMQSQRPDIYQMILEADRASRERCSGHGNAIAQGYGHVILPLANPRDKQTQVLWGIRDFEHRFGRRPEGMWLPETAVDTPTLEVLAEHGIQFTVLAPRQAAAFRQLGTDKWTELKDHGVDPTQAYLCMLPSGRQICLFFYDGPVSQAVAFEQLLESGERFMDRLTSGYDEARTWPQLMHIATDGETYGHHHRHGDMALSFAIHSISGAASVRLTNYGEYLQLHPPTHEVRIVENSSWSCIHGIERWRSNCGCNSGMNGGWNQEWRAPLRAALDWLRDTVAPKYEAAAGRLLKDPWKARDEYIEVVLDRSRESIEGFCDRHAGRRLSEQERVTALKLLELQRHAMLMYTSCGWFFDELSGIETVQVIQYAGRVAQLAREALQEDLEPGFEETLAAARSNVLEHRDGRWIYQHLVRPAEVSLEMVGAHFAIKTLFEPGPEVDRVYAFDVHVQDAQRFSAGRAKLLVGRAQLVSRVTMEAATLSYGVLHLGDHILNGGVRHWQGDRPYAEIVERMHSAFDHADYAQVIREMDVAFGESNYGLRNLFKDEQRSIMDRVLADALREVEHTYRHIYNHHAPLLRYFASLKLKAPEALQGTARIVLDGEIRRGLRPWAIDLDRVRNGLREAREQAVQLDTVSIAFDLGRLLSVLAERLGEAPDDVELLRQLRDGAAIGREHRIEVQRWKARNVCYDLAYSLYPMRRQAPEHQEWVQIFRDLAEQLHIRVE
jgi:alpha-amylase/alpha-mannosidase (GH57 family)